MLPRIWIAGVLAMSACYSPDLRDCTVTCASNADCAGDQVCGATGWCAAPGSGATCAEHPMTADAATSDAPARAIDAEIHADASPSDAASADVKLVVTVTGKGTVTGGSGESCAGNAIVPTTCTFTVVEHVAVTLTEAAGAGNETFVSWSGACSGSAPTCVVTPDQASTTVGAMFAKHF